MKQPKYKLKGYYYTNQNGCLVSEKPMMLAMYSGDSFNSIEDAKNEWCKDPWLEDRKKCILATEIVKRRDDEVYI